MLQRLMRFFGIWGRLMLNGESNRGAIANAIYLGATAVLYFLPGNPDNWLLWAVWGFGGRHFNWDFAPWQVLAVLMAVAYPFYYLGVAKVLSAGPRLEIKANIYRPGDGQFFLIVRNPSHSVTVKGISAKGWLTPTAPGLLSPFELYIPKSILQPLEPLRLDTFAMGGDKTLAIRHELDGSIASTALPYDSYRLHIEVYKEGGPCERSAMRFDADSRDCLLD